MNEKTAKEAENAYYQWIISLQRSLDDDVSVKEAFIAGWLEANTTTEALLRAVQ